MIEFVYKLNEILPTWQIDSIRNLQQISQATQTSLPHVLLFLNEGLNKELDINSQITLDEATEAMLILSKKLKPQIEERERQLANLREASVQAYDKIMVKVRNMQSNKENYSAYRTLGYFAGKHEQYLPQEFLLTLCNDIIRLGNKAQANLQELAKWLEKGVLTAVSEQSKEGLEEALDLIDAHSEYFKNQKTGKGILVLSRLLADLEEPCIQLELWEEYKALVDQIFSSK
ncbi:MAG: hypothetical protein CMP11_08675 [Zetaproteobacteria bacterium]|nr:hypothetical protein [Pseudobdellovibrionaceae bacterium]|tara:strand:- start:2173 stop:2865 length:693 start_codon:yes stop_codon:yes gene_type:complete